MKDQLIKYHSIRIWNKEERWYEPYEHHLQKLVVTHISKNHFQTIIYIIYEGDTLKPQLIH